MRAAIIIIGAACWIGVAWYLYQTYRVAPVQMVINNVQINSVDWRLALDHIRAFETLKTEPYKDRDEYYIGYGHQIQDNEAFLMNGITEECAEDLLVNDMENMVIIASNKYNLTGNKALALAMLMFNLGVSGFRCDKNNQATTLYLMLKGVQPFDKDSFRRSWESFCNYNGKEHKQLRERRRYECNLYFK